jgi:hypothetical protein
LARDNFTKETITKLKARVAYRCSNPDCRVQITAPSSKEGVSNIGIAAHICAASQGGPRYDSAMNSTERKSLSNGIWLCSNCSILIDRDTSTFTIQKLNEWKQNAERLAREEQGRKLPSDTEVVDTLTAALTGYPKSFISNAISNTHKSSELALESLDSRFVVNTAYSSGRSLIEIHPKEHVPLSITMDTASEIEFRDKHRQLIEHGRDLEITSNTISIEGSKLFEDFFSSKLTTFNIYSKKVKGTQKLWLVNSTTNHIETFDDIQGEISFGTKSLTYKGTACNKLFSFGYKKLFDDCNHKANIKMSLNLDIWDGTSLTYLPYFKKLQSLFAKMSEGWEVFTSLEVEGMNVFSSVGLNVSDWDFCLDTTNYLNYLNCCRIISEQTKTELYYTSSLSFTSEEYAHLADIVDTFEGVKVYSEDDLSENFKTVMCVNNQMEGVTALLNMKEPTSFRILKQTNDFIELFGINIPLPQIVISINSVLPKFNREITNLMPDSKIDIEWIPQKDFNCIFSYDS